MRALESEPHSCHDSLTLSITSCGCREFKELCAASPSVGSARQRPPWELAHLCQAQGPQHKAKVYAWNT